MNEEPRIAVLDLGSNSFHLLVARARPDGTLVRLDSHKEMVRLGSTLGTGVLDPEAWKRGMDAVDRLVTRARAVSPHRLLAVATSAIREARNGDEFAASVRRDYDLDVEVLTGEDEAHLVHRGVCSEGPADAGLVLVVDVGGGSVEVALGSQRRCRMVVSLPLGALRLRTAFLPPDGSLSDAQARSIATLVRQTAGPALRAVQAECPDRVVFTAGTARTLAALAGSLGLSPVGSPLTRSLVLHVRTLLSRFRPSQLPALGVEDQRVDTISVGAVVVETILELLGDQLGVASARVSSRGLREGVALREAWRLVRQWRPDVAA